MQELKKFFPEEVLDKAHNVVAIFQDDVLINNSLIDGDAILVVVYMLSNKNKSNYVKYEEAQNLYVKSGKEKESFRKALYELTKRFQKGMINRNEDGTLSLTFSGVNHIKTLLEGKYK